VPKPARGSPSNLERTVHRDGPELARIVLHDQRLDDVVLGHAELTRRLGRAAAVHVVVGVLVERDAVASQPRERGRLAETFLFPGHSADSAERTGGDPIGSAARPAIGPCCGCLPG